MATALMAEGCTRVQVESRLTTLRIKERKAAAAGTGKQRAEEAEDEASDSEAEPSASDEEQDAAPSPAPMQTGRQASAPWCQAALTAAAGSPKLKPARTARAAMGTPGKQQPRKSNRAPAARKLDDDYDYD